ncbi:hypothetical protein B0T26DRAFT_865314 [Lasiosphaeria miniovina]|uniref:Uncharacterized protein n=1 Tax=Lasiosphaeria miniovina TaxID=1954250 RepID=A0AA40DJX0_9PEZI|nr:uncharacterized protein B0T26DRAFT_865314 [Lasiosphaeria miniovina]KAK0704076.1 hypothetical protein B0T26DRAFT_865314 [Lasiosphaeria miniovina]
MLLGTLVRKTCRLKYTATADRNTLLFFLTERHLIDPSTSLATMTDQKPWEDKVNEEYHANIALSAARPPAPFSVNILIPNDDCDGDDVDDGGGYNNRNARGQAKRQLKSHQDELLMDQFPASYRSDGDDLHAPTVPNAGLILRELDVRRLHDIVHLLWLAGRPVPPRPLHYQLSVGRDIVVRELMETHLVWGSGHIFVKPIPRYLLNPRFWALHLSCDPCIAPGGRDGEEPGVAAASAGGAAAATTTATTITAPCNNTNNAIPCCQQHRHLRQCALGFLLSYVALVVHESDFAIAKDRRLIPEEVTWPRWRTFVRQILAGGGSANGLYGDAGAVAPRFIYGELRLNRLNIILFALRGPLSAGFMPTWRTYGSFLRDNSAWIIAATAYIVVVLSAMQVGLSTDRLADDASFQAASYGFSVFSILVPIAMFLLLVLFSAFLWIYNSARTRQFERHRARVLGRTWSDKRARGEDGHRSVA